MFFRKTDLQTVYNYKQRPRVRGRRDKYANAAGEFNPTAVITKTGRGLGSAVLLIIEGN